MPCKSQKSEKICLNEISIAHIKYDTIIWEKIERVDNIREKDALDDNHLFDIHHMLYDVGSVKFKPYNGFEDDVTFVSVGYLSLCLFVIITESC